MLPQACFVVLAWGQIDVLPIPCGRPALPWGVFLRRGACVLAPRVVKRRETVRRSGPRQHRILLATMTRTG
jgi:hypothetical protein